MDFLELAKQRYSSRKYSAKVVEDNKLNTVLEAGRIAPSAANYQPWVFIIVKGENIENVRNCYPRDWFKTAHIYIILCANHSQSWKRADDKGIIRISLSSDQS